MYHKLGYAFGIDRIIQICGKLNNIEDSVYLPKNKMGKHELLETDEKSIKNEK